MNRIVISKPAYAMVARGDPPRYMCGVSFVRNGHKRCLEGFEAPTAEECTQMAVDWLCELIEAAKEAVR